MGNAHDMCFSTCGTSFMTCEENFHHCLSGAFKMLGWATDAFGCKYFKEAQLQRCKCHSNNETVQSVDGDCHDYDDITTKPPSKTTANSKSQRPNIQKINQIRLRNFHIC